MANLPFTLKTGFERTPLAIRAASYVGGAFAVAAVPVFLATFVVSAEALPLGSDALVLIGIGLLFVGFQSLLAGMVAKNVWTAMRRARDDAEERPELEEALLFSMAPALVRRR